MRRRGASLVLACALVAGVAQGASDAAGPQSFEDFVACAERGVAWCAFRVAKALYTGDGVTLDKAKAADWYRVAAELGDLDSASDLGAMLVEGDGVPRDVTEGARLILLAGEGGSAWAANRVGYIYSKGLGVDRDLAEAVRWYRRAAEGGNRTGMFNLAWRYYDGSGVRQSYAKARDWCERALAEGPRADADWLLGQMLLEGRGTRADPILGRSHLERSARAGYSRAQILLADHLRNGTHLERDIDQARVWYQALIEAEDSAGLYGMAMSYRDAAPGVADYTEALAWMERAARANHEAAQNDLGVLHEKGRGTPRDDSEAVRWYRAAAENGDQTAPNNLGVMLEDGRGAPRDEDAALDWFRKGVDSGNGASANNIGWMHVDGRAVERNEREAKRWFREARRLGFEPERRRAPMTRDAAHHRRLRALGVTPFSLAFEWPAIQATPQAFEFAPASLDGRVRGELRIMGLDADLGEKGEGTLAAVVVGANEQLTIRLVRAAGRDVSHIELQHDRDGTVLSRSEVGPLVNDRATVPFELQWGDGAPLRLRLFDQEDRFFTFDGVVRVRIEARGVDASIPFLTFD